MDDGPTDASTEAALHEYIDVAITVAELETPGQEETLHRTLENFPGVQKVSIAGGRLAVHYEPVRITKARLLEAIHGAGFHTADVKSTPASPLTDAFAEGG